MRFNSNFELLRKFKYKSKDRKLDKISQKQNVQSLNFCCQIYFVIQFSILSLFFGTSVSLTFTSHLPIYFLQIIIIIFFKNKLNFCHQFREAQMQK